ncbi:hypothetical protein HR45_15735 [Shewanella mangrovi]|uniref:Lipoprotein n=1 Tax=Shewanella mangrovi TaxID=1515746 RepID=A0A094J9H7_9GAMM|nr:hypothetical protein [Shewanella mangrovi]KFZ36580.1 hypothetical protein HR45_15735 [Shewanella mangrovi]
MTKVSIALLLLLLSGCSCTGHFLQEANVTLSDATTLSYSGETSVNSAKYALKLARQHPEIKRLIINSDGGDAIGGMMLGEWVHRQQIVVEVKQRCFATCANYVVTAAAETVVGPDAQLGWFGGAWQPDTDRPWYTFLIPGYDKNHNLTLADWRAVEQEYFARIGVREEITILGEVTKFKQQRQQKGMWSYCPQDLHKLGVRNIRFADNTVDADIEVLQFAPGELELFLANSPIKPQPAVAGL